MKKHTIDLSTLKPHGKVVSEMRAKKLWMTVTSANPLSHCKPGASSVHYVELPNRYTLPLRIDITAKIDAPAMYLLLGSGHANFGTHWSDNRRLDDICAPNQQTNFFNSYIPMNTFTDISLLYDIHEMQILVNNEERYYSKKERYMKSPLFASMNKDGFTFRLSCDKRTEMTVKSIRVTEYDDTAGIVHTADIADAKPMPLTGKPSFESCISGLPDNLRTTIVALDAWLRSLQPLKFKRQLEKNGNRITYVASDYGFSYAIHPSNDVLYHTLQWYIVTNGKPETWHRKANLMETVLNHLAQTDAQFAQRMFDNLCECVGGFSSGCLAKTPYTFQGKHKMTCHGKMWFKMHTAEFDDVKRFIGTLNTLV